VRVVYDKEKEQESSSTSSAPLLREHERNMEMLLRLLRFPQTRSILEEYLKIQYAEENLEFWCAVQRWRSLPASTEKTDLSSSIFQKFFAKKAECELNVETKREIEDKMKEDPNDPHLFDEPEFFIVRMLAETKFLLHEKANLPCVKHTLYFN